MADKSDDTSPMKAQNAYQKRETHPEDEADRPAPAGKREETVKSPIPPGGEDAVRDDI